MLKEKIVLQNIFSNCLIKLLRNCFPKHSQIGFLFFLVIIFTTQNAGLRHTIGYAEYYAFRFRKTPNGNKAFINHVPTKICMNINLKERNKNRQHSLTEKRRKIIRTEDLTRRRNLQNAITTLKASPAQVLQIKGIGYTKMETHQMLMMH